MKRGRTRTDGKLVAAGRTLSGSNYNFAVDLNERLYVTHDANFNVTGLIDDGGEVVERYKYDPYGVATAMTGEWGAQFPSGIYGWIYLHQGGRLNRTAGLYHFRYRDYSPSLGWWVRIDPKRYVDGASLYQYVMGNPLRLLDAMGLAVMPIEERPIFEPTTQPTVNVRLVVQPDQVTTRSPVKQVTDPPDPVFVPEPISLVPDPPTDLPPELQPPTTMPILAPITDPYPTDPRPVLPGLPSMPDRGSEPVVPKGPVKK